ncbi:hypothetical protein YC2023_054389 [Brassica napus]
MKKLETDGSDCSSRLERNEDHMTEEFSTLTTGKKAKRLFIKVCVHSMEHWESVCADFLCHENKGIAAVLNHQRDSQKSEVLLVFSDAGSSLTFPE